MNHQELMHEMDQAIVEAKAAAEARIAEELQEDMRRKLPIFLRRFERGANHKNPIRAGIMAAMVETLKEDQKRAAGFFLSAIANQHLRRWLMDDIADEVELACALYHQVRVSQVVDSVLKGCALLIECYPAIARPDLPRRCDVAKQVNRYCRHGQSKPAMERAEHIARLLGSERK